MRSICVFTGTRAEYSLLKPVMRGILQRADCALHTLVSGTHLSAGFGRTEEEILADGLPVTHRADILSSASLPDAMGVALPLYSGIFKSGRPDLLLLLGDRYEAFAAATAATLCSIPIAHIHGGEATFGLMDEPFRHSITKMSHLHFTACEAYRQRVIQLGESPERVFNVGSLGVENIHNEELLDEKSLRGELGLDDAPFFLCTFHPVTLEPGNSPRYLADFCAALEEFPEYKIVFTGANADAEGGEINAFLTRKAQENSRYRFFMSLGQRRYFSAVRAAACVAGNSSSGILEVPSLRVPVLDIGNRQAGRVRSEAVLHCAPEKDAIAAALRHALSPEHKTLVLSAVNPFDKAGTARAIVDCLARYPLEGILEKHFYDLPLPAGL